MGVVYCCDLLSFIPCSLFLLISSDAEMPASVFGDLFNAVGSKITMVCAASRRTRVHLALVAPLPSPSGTCRAVPESIWHLSRRTRVHLVDCFRNGCDRDPATVFDSLPLTLRATLTAYRQAGEQEDHAQKHP
jgi:hypothetical protein